MVFAVAPPSKKATSSTVAKASTSNERRTVPPLVRRTFGGGYLLCNTYVQTSDWLHVNVLSRRWTIEEPPLEVAHPPSNRPCKEHDSSPAHRSQMTHRT
jgi:hypothetical protein